MKYKIFFVGVLLTLIISVFIIQMNQINELRKENTRNIIQYQKEVDSLKDDIFALEINVNRYEIALDILRDINPSSAEKFEDILSTQTE